MKDLTEEDKKLELLKKAGDYLPELQGLMQDSVIEEAELSDIDTEKVESSNGDKSVSDHKQSNFQLQILQEFEEHKRKTLGQAIKTDSTQPSKSKMDSNLTTARESSHVKTSENQDAQSTKSSSGQSSANFDEASMRKKMEQIKNPLFRTFERPDVLDVIYNDCIRTYNKKKGLDIYKERPDELVEMTSSLTQFEETAFKVKLVHEQLTMQADWIKGNTSSTNPAYLRSILPDKQAVLNQLRQCAAQGTNASKYSASLKLPIGRRGSTQLTQYSNPLARGSTQTLTGLVESITESTASLSLNDQRQDLKDLHCKRLLIDLYEAASLQRVTVKLLIDFEKFLELQRKLPKEYIDKRISVALPIVGFDEQAQEAEILSKIISDRRKAKADPLTCEFIKRDPISHKKVQVKGHVLDYDFETRRYLIEDTS